MQVTPRAPSAQIPQRICGERRGEKVRWMEIVEARVSSRAKSPQAFSSTRAAEYTQKAHESMNGMQGKCRKSNPIKSSKI